MTKSEGFPQAGEPDALDRWAAFFRGFSTILLIANSDAVRIDDLRARYGEDALFVFFNKVYKVLDRPFDGPCLLVARSGPAGANIVYRREVGEVTKLVRSPRFRGICNLRAGAAEQFSPSDEFAIPERVGHLDLSADLSGFYPETHLATSGFALALFLIEVAPESKVVLAGFTARRSQKWKLFADHDWTFEQIVLRLLLRSGRLHMTSSVAPDLFGAVSRRFPEFTPGDVSSVAAEVLTERLEGANLAIDDLLKLTRPQRRFDALLRRLKPKTRKAKLAERQAQQ
ncbi:3-deoxy-manno-octulosonate cytidylyltransferase [Aureimonas ureilytica]|uniref:3-deoxy-manno-octulosonate cytidylyltransferase n=1 Tax=Aureimonas ureilytica TaxID=401562 RepID=A0A175RAF3_9HYPH|nr:hypothetical protein [Aureimonas ureilytica]KTQ96722.1 3-deoxy-manno-octulosonate cytidylyltransferase [Aureimonas ureilytica]